MIIDRVRNTPYRWVIFALALLVSGWALGAKVSNVRATKHNLSKNWGGSSADPRTVKADTETQVCVFCHTPHAATSGANPLWNRKLSDATYTTYTSSTLDSAVIEGALSAPGGSSKLCLSCHDGTLAIGSVNVLNGAGTTTPGTNMRSISMSGTGAGGVMPSASGQTTGFTRFLGTDLTNDHPISVTYNKSLTDRDGELRAATKNGTDNTWEFTYGGKRIVGVRNSTQGFKPTIPVEQTGSATDAGQVQCASCHDPHLEETDTSKGNQKFLRQNRFQAATPTVSYSESNDIICLSCHDKNGTAGSWAFSAHANPLVATPTYTSTAASQREFPANLPVWQAACLNCHDTHTIPGARRLLREATDSTASPKTGGNSAIEETCYQCHTTSGASAITPSNAPNIKTEFASTTHMPITGTEVHDISSNFNDATFIDCSGVGSTAQCGKDLIESRSTLGVGHLSNRHVECPDCHNPHRVVKFKDFRGAAGGGTLSGTPDSSGTHKHTDDANTTHSNIASGVLRGSWGVEPVYGSASFDSLPTGYTVKRGDPGSSSNSAVSMNWVTREYQVCLKCHSDYGYSDNNSYSAGNRPALGSFIGGTASGTNNLTMYTNQAKEFQAPSAHKGETSTTDSGASSSYSTNNHRSWHPVIDSTGRTHAVRGITTTGGTAPSTYPWRSPWSNAVGTQTMYCSDCHGADIGSASETVIPTGSKPWGPHGSSNNFILKGEWSGTTGASGQNATYTSNALCFKCHNKSKYADGTSPSGSDYSSGFCCDGKGNLHIFHTNKIQKLRCSWCHVAVPHGWKNKAFLVNLNDVGAEAGLTAGTQVRLKTTAAYNMEPYYNNAMLKVKNFKASGAWTAGDCGSAGGSGNGATGKTWMRDSTENCKSPP